MNQINLAHRAATGQSLVQHSLPPFLEAEATYCLLISNRIARVS